MVALDVHPKARQALGGGVAVRAIKGVPRVVVDIPHVGAQTTDAGEALAARWALHGVAVVMMRELRRWWNWS